MRSSAKQIFPCLPKYTIAYFLTKVAIAKRKRSTQNDQRAAKSRRRNDGRHKRTVQEEESIDDEAMHDGMEEDGIMDDASSEMFKKEMKQYILAFLKVSEFISYCRTQ